MNVGIGLPITDPAALSRWARRADAGPFSTLGLLDRLVYDNPEPLVTLAALAGATSRIRVQTEVLLAPLRQAALLAKQAATLDRLFAGRFTLGIGIGGRADDHLAAGVELAGRGRRLDQQMELMRRVWAGDPVADSVGPIGPRPARPGGPEVLFGGFAPAALARVARWGDGLLAAAPLDYTGQLFRMVEEFWQQAAREGRPRLVAQVNVALGPDETVRQARAALRGYYAFSDHVEQADAALITSARGVREAIASFGELGATEVMLYCWSADIDQIDRLAHALP